MAKLSLNTSSSVDLLDGDDGFKLRLDGWIPQIARKNGTEYENVIETITLKATGSNASNLINSVIAKIENAIDWIDLRINDPVAFESASIEYQPDGQSDALHSMILGLSYSLGNSPFFPPVTNQRTYPNLTLQIERKPYWEKLGLQAYSPLLRSGGESGLITKTNTGSHPGRVSYLSLSTSGAILNEFWIGFRSNKFGWGSYFNPVWLFDTVTTSNDATESGGVVSWSSGDSSLLERMRISLSQRADLEASLYRYQRGTFAVLLRARSTGTETFNVRLTDGFYRDSSSNRTSHSRVRVSGTGFKFYPLGTVVIPPIPSRSPLGGYLSSYTLGLDAEVATAGTGNFEATRFVLVPQDEGFLHVKGIATGLIGTTYIRTSPYDILTAYTLWSDDKIDIPSEIDTVRFVLPQGDTYLTFAGQGTTQTINDQGLVNMNYDARWLGMGVA